MSATLNLGNGDWATKENSLLGYNSENGNYKPLPFDFTRASSATVVNKAGLIETVQSGIPRIDFSDSTKGALLLEPQRSNYVTSSESITPFFTTDGTTLTQNYGVSPTGENNSVLLTQNTGSVNQSIYNFGLPTTDGDYSYSFFFRAGTSTNVRFYVANAKSENFNPQTVTAGIVNGVNLNLLFEDYGNGWFRVSTTVTLSGASFNRFLVYPDRDDLGRNIEIFGFQYETNASYPTSYIPTQGSAVTRVADVCSQTVPDGIIGQTEGTMYCEIDFKSKPEAGSPIVGIIALNNNVSNLQNCIILGIERQSGGTNRFYPFVQVGNSTVAYIIGGTLTDGVYKAAFAYKENDFVLYVNGVQIGTDTLGAVPATSQVLVGERYNNDSVKIADGIKETKLYNTRLTNAELATLTTI